MAKESPTIEDGLSKRARKARIPGSGLVSVMGGQGIAGGVEDIMGDRDGNRVHRGQRDLDEQLNAHCTQSNGNSLTQTRIVCTTGFAKASMEVS